MLANSPAWLIATHSPCSLAARNIVRHEGFGVDIGGVRLVPFQLQEFAGGGAIEDLLRMNSPKGCLRPKYGLATGLKWCVEVAKAVEYLHSNAVNVVHRDLKLGNILLTERDLSQASIRLADFGLAVELSEDSPTAYLSKVRIYMSVYIYFLDAGMVNISR